MRIGIGQINPTVGDIPGNTAVIVRLIDEARAAGCELVVFPELAVPGYSPLDLLWQPDFVPACESAVNTICKASHGIGVLVGSVTAQPSRDPTNHDNVSSVSDGGGTALYDCAYLLENQSVIARVDKLHLPTYDVDSERRYYTPGAGAEVHRFRDLRMGINICEDIWIDDGPTDVQASLGAEWIVNLSASPFYRGKPEIRRQLVARRASENGIPVLYANLVGGQDGIIFDGGSFAVDREGQVRFRAPAFEDGLFLFDTTLVAADVACSGDDLSQVRQAIVLGIRDYLRKNGFTSVIVALSGGIDSALVTALAVDAVGANAVTTVYMPSIHSSPESGEDASACAAALGVEHMDISIDAVYAALQAAMPTAPEGIVDENLQPRVRGTVLMALANQRNALALCPANKSEAAVGYNTLYGDTVGAIAPIVDLYKADVYAMARMYSDRIPERILTKPPSAELRPDQTDQDDLPSYDVLDPIVREAVENHRTYQQLVKMGYDKATVRDVLDRIRRSEYKRAQLPPGIKVTPKAFGIGRRMPITNRFRSE